MQASSPEHQASVPVPAPVRPALVLLGLSLAGSLLTTAQAQTEPAATRADTPATASPPAPPAQPAAPRSTPATAPALERVEITGGSASDTEARRQSTASRIVVGREEIERYGDSSVAEVLKRLPGVTLGGRPGRGGEIRMRGLGSGYTQILVNGERMSPGFSLDTLSPEQLERIEVMRAPTAEHSTQAIAGTINLVLRENVRKRLNQFQLSPSREAGEPQYGAGWTRADQLGSFSYNLSANAFDRWSPEQIDSDSDSRTLSSGSLQQSRHDHSVSLDHRSGVHLGGRMQWRLDGGDTLALMPFLMHSQGRSQGSTQRRVISYDASGNPTATDSSLQSHDSSSFTLARVNGQWQTRLAGGSRLELKAGANLARSRSDALHATNGISDDDEHASVRSSGWSQAGKYTHVLQNDHSIGLGWDLEQGRRDEERQGSVLGSPLDAQLQTGTRRAALWAQDEWEFGPRWSAYAGLRWEGILTRSDWLAANLPQSAANRSSVWSPLLHSAWKLDDQGREQIRASLTRSYRAPSTTQLAGRTLRNEPNSQTNPDQAGNPALRPELATGFDLAFEHYLSSGGLLSASLFHRRISDYIRSTTTLTAGRWISQVQNVGDARSSGIELEAKFRASELFDTRASLDLRANLSLYRSQVDGVPGPDNRLDRQPWASANLGADYRFIELPFSIGANLGWTPANAVQLSASERAESGIKRALDAYLLWRVTPNADLRLSGANLLADDQTATRTQTDASSIEQTRSSTAAAPIWSLRLELRY
ncbi:MAG: hypothetical protein RJA44_2404 [Pseudomonadota bacterium]